MTTSTFPSSERVLRGRRVGLFGRFASMPRRQVEQLLRGFGGVVVAPIDGHTELVVVSDDSPDVQRIVEESTAFDESGRAAWAEGRLQFVRESALWEQLGLVDSPDGGESLYTPAMLADLVRVPVRAIRHWHRKGHLGAVREFGRLPYFDFEQVRVALRLAQLLSAGCSLTRIDRKLGELARLLPEIARPLADPAIVVEGSRLVVRRGDSLSEPSGQLLIDFDTPRDDPENHDLADAVLTIPITVAAHPGQQATAESGQGSPAESSDDLRSLAEEFEESGQTDRAIEVYRAILMSGQSTAEDHFYLADLLYRCGDPSAARERYYAAIEIDEDYVEARANLGCVLAELGDMPLAAAAFRGALEYHPDFADAHFHLARLLDRVDQPAEAAWHWKRFLELAPASPWAEEAMDRTEGMSVS